jgi:hypothetical protein
MKHLGTTVAAVDYGAVGLSTTSIPGIAGEFIELLILILDHSPIGV